MLSIKIEFGQGFTLKDVITKCNEQNINTKIIRKIDDSNNTNISIQIDEKYHEDVINILDWLEIKNKYCSCQIMLTNKINTSNLKDLNILDESEAVLAFTTNKSLLNLFRYIEEHTSENDKDLIIELICNVLYF